jgi:hypothetical protein
MSSWNIARCFEQNCDFMLLNSSRTAIRFSNRTKIEITEMLVSMEDHNVPIAYTNELKEIYFTFLRGRTAGDYLDGRIRLSCQKDIMRMMDRTLIHEIAHHLDDRENLSGEDNIMKEKKSSACELGDSYAKKNIGEYIAIGFEVFYFGTKQEKSKMRKDNPKLYTVIKNLHKRYSQQ